MPLIADHGDALTALPFVAPVLVIVAALLALGLRERLRDSADGDG